MTGNDISSILTGAGAAASGIGNLINGTESQAAPYQSQAATPAAANSGGAAPITPSLKDNTLLYVGIGIVVVAVAAYFVMR